MNDSPTTGSPPIPTMVELPSPRSASSLPIWYVSVPERRHEPDPAAGEHLGGDDPDVREPGRQHARAVGADQRDPAGAQVVVDAQHVVGGDALGDAHDRRDAGVGRLEDRVAGEPGRHEDHRRVRAGRAAPRRATVSKTGMPSTSWPPLPGVTPATTFVP